MNLAVHYITYFPSHGALVHFGIDVLDQFCHGISHGEMHPALRAQQSGLHREKVIALRFLEIGIAAFQQELTSLQVVVGVILIGYRHRKQINLGNITEEILVAGESQHLDKAVLRHVA